VQAGNASYSADDRAALQLEADQLLAGITSEANQAKFNGEALFSDSTHSIGGDPNKRAFLDRLKVGWLNEAENLIRTYFGLQGDGASLRIDVDSFTDGGSNVLAYVQGTVNGNGSWSNLSMNFDMADFGPPNTSSDRVVAHELMHAVMARTMNISAMPQWFVEGTAELIHGGDERLAGSIAGSSVAAVVASVGGGFSYEGSYAANRYLHDQLKDMGVTGGIKGLMQYLDQNQAANLDVALNAVTGGVYATAAAFVADFTANGEVYINTQMNLTNGDTGGIGGLDADGGTLRSSTSVLNDTNAYPSVLEGFDEIFPTIGGTTETKRYVLQVGENVGDTLRVELSALNASALGLSGFDLQGLGALNIMHMDEALEYVSRQRANVGASIARLESISTTLAARSENLSASRSRIRDADYAAETAELTKTMILQQSATSIIAQANATPQLTLALLR
jgi:flagellin